MPSFPKGGTTLQAIKQVIQHLSSTKRYDRLLRNVQVVSAEPGHCICQLKVAEEHLNGYGTLHGGFTSTLVDSLTTFAVMSTEAGVPGVSVSLNVNFLKAAKPGEEIQIDAKVVKHGKTLAFTEAQLTNSDGATLATGQHVKYIA
ncbi:acyl-coenzyme A thioesterase 13-like [Anneissia japonica]|uniref:acyl-coenzyme A thioesterase 13-like n=1 Tax=Anneissia japonica TaxID=1529436 RepID=UPI0014259CAE|nr:acyl-coenzyme A thioesterase 13-like [Anneissia japonica]